MNLANTIRMLSEKRSDPPFDVSKADYAGAAKELTQYAKTKGGIDKNDFLAFANRMSAIANKKSPRVSAKFARDLMDLDTSPREKIVSVMRSNGIKVTVQGGGFKIEELTLEELEELDELEEAKVMGREVHDKTFANRTQADNFAKKNGGRVRQVGRVFYVFKEEIEEAYKTPAEASAYEAGKKAVAKKVSYDDNPNKKGTKEYTAWSKGHNDARAKMIANRHTKEEVELDELKKYDKNKDYQLLNRLSQKAKTGNLTPSEKSQMANAKSRLRNHGFSEEVELQESPMVTYTVSNVTSDMAIKLERLAKEKGVEHSRKGRTVVLKGKRSDVTSIRTKMGIAQTNTPMEPVKEEVELEEKFKVGDKVKVKKGTLKSPDQRHYETKAGTIVKDYKDGEFKINFGGNDDFSIEGKFLVKEEVEEARDPSKSGGSGYDLYHKDFSSAMKHAYDYAKKKFGIEIDPKEIDDKVASGPRKPSAGKTNSYRLKSKDGKKGVQIQVANLDNKKYELNMYKEEVEMENIEEAEFFKWEVKIGGKSWRGTARNAGEAVKKARPSMGNLDLTKASVTRIKEDIDMQEEQKISLEEAVMLSVFGEAKKDEKKDKKAPETDKDDDGEGMDPVDKKALKKDYDDRAKDGDGDIDNDGDEDKNDKYLHKKRQAVTKAIAKKKGPESSKKGEPVDTNPTMDEEKGEEMTSSQKEKKDEIMKKLEQRKKEFEEKYGDRAKEVMARTAVKMAKKHA